MAGSFPDVPGFKLYYQEDGSTVFSQVIATGVVTLRSAADAVNLASEYNTTNVAGSVTDRVGVLFPQATDIVGIYFGTSHAADTTNAGIVRTSPDTTNGADGTWTDQTTTLPVRGVNLTYAWRTNVEPVNYPAVKGLTISATGTYAGRMLHLYGQPSSGAAPDRLRFWHPTSNVEVPAAHFDYGNQARGLTVVKAFRVKNSSAALTARTVNLTTLALRSPSPTLVSQTMFSTDQTNWTASLTWDSIAPGATTGIAYVRLALTTTAALAPWRERLAATATSWT